MASRMRILAISEAYLPTVGGNVAYVRDLSSALVKRGHEVFLVVPAADKGGGACQLIRPDTSQTPAEAEDVVNELLESGNEQENRQRFIADVRARVVDWIKELEPHVIHIMYGHYVHRAFPALAIPLIWTCQNVPPREYASPFHKENWLSWVGNAVYRAAVRHKHHRIIRTGPYDAIITASERVKRTLVDEVNVDSQRVHVVGIGVVVSHDSGRVRRNKLLPGRLRLLTVGAIKQHKGVDLIPDIIHILRSSGIATEWSVIGQLENCGVLQRARARASRLGTDDAVTWRGCVSPRDLAAAYEEADLYVHLSREEGFCIVVLEAMSCGTPVVGTNVGAIPEMIKGGRGVVVEPTVESIASGIRWAYFNYDVLRSGEELIDYVERCHGWDQVARATEGVYDAVAKMNLGDR